MWLKIEYEGKPDYCIYCKLQGHLETACKNKARDERIKAQQQQEKLEKHAQEHNKDSEDGFIKGRSITDNIMLTQEMVHNMNTKKPNDNIILKLDMAKAYDRVS